MKCKLVLGLIVSFSIIIFSQPSDAGPCDTLQSGQAAFFEHSKYRGACVVRKVGRYSKSRGIGIGNDKISSIKVGYRTQVRLCKDRGFRGGCSTYTKSTPSLGRMNDQTSSAIISRVRISLALCTPKAKQIAVYADVDFRGACNVLGVDSYINSRRIGVADNTISSVYVSPGMRVRLCKDRGFRGGCSTYTNRTPSLGRMNNKTSSAIVSRVKPLSASDKCKPKANQIAVFEHVNYKGACSLLGTGSYRNSSQIGIANDTMSSVLVGKNAAIVGFRDTNFRVRYLYSDKNTPRIKRGDAISSLKVLKTR